ncbi:6691_t:CDS:2, partial [Funneliformis geosporum]
LSVKMNDLIVYTSLSSVFGVCYDENAVVKIVSRSYILLNEINVLTKLGVNDGIIRLDGSSDTAMLLRSRAVETFKNKCHENGIVHGDTRLTNILLDKNGKLILIDFGCGSDAGKEWYGNGPRLPLLSLRLIRLTTISTFVGRWNPQIFTDYQDDLYTLIQSIYIHLNKDYVLQALENNIEDLNHVISFWDKVFVDEWKIAKAPKFTECKGKFLEKFNVKLSPLPLDFGKTETVTVSGKLPRYALELVMVMGTRSLAKSVDFCACPAGPGTKFNTPVKFNLRNNNTPGPFKVLFRLEIGEEILVLFPNFGNLKIFSIYVPKIYHF